MPAVNVQSCWHGANKCPYLILLRWDWASFISIPLLRSVSVYSAKNCIHSVSLEPQALVYKIFKAF